LFDVLDLIFVLHNHVFYINFDLTLTQTKSYKYFPTILLLRIKQLHKDY